MKSKAIGLIAISLFLVLCGWLYSRQGILRLASVDIENTENKELVISVKRMVAPHLGANLLTLSLADLQNNLQSDSRIKKVFISRKLPSTLHFKIVERVPVARANLKSNSSVVVGDEGEPILELVSTESLPTWIRYKKAPSDRKKLISDWLFQLKSSDRSYFEKISEFQWIENRGLVLSILSRPSDKEMTAGWIQVEMGTSDFAERWVRLRLVLDWVLDDKIQGERLIALSDGQVVISGVKNLHNLKNELNLKEIVRRATPQSDTRVQAR